MNIKIIQSGKGDCLLINSDDKYILVDGGVSSAYNIFATKELSKLQKKGITLDLACVSHIDDDHIGGFLKMIEDLVQWRVYDYQKTNGNTQAKKPKVLRPCEIKEIWHNAFQDIEEENAGAIEDMLAAMANILSASTNPKLLEMAEIAFGERNAIQLSRRLKPGQLNIPLNTASDGKLMMYRDNTQPVKIGNLSITVIAPFEEDLAILRDEWNEWLADHQKAIKEVREKVERDSGIISSSSTPDLTYYQALAKEWEPALLAQLATVSGELGNRKKVTAPNLASIMFLIEEGDTTVLMTGDGHADDITKGLEAIGKLDADGSLHLDVLKVQHHGAEYNIHEDFCNRITANHYIFCGNGEHQNPDLRVIQAIVDSRTTKPAKTAQAKNVFTLWFNSSPDGEGSESALAHMKEIDTLVKQLSSEFPKLKYKFIDPVKNYLSLTV
jgi:beta-lactamase superfamily II metal-dependent hydrolase